MEEHCKVVEEGELRGERKEPGLGERMEEPEAGEDKRGVTNHQDFGRQMVLESRLLSVVL